MEWPETEILVATHVAATQSPIDCLASITGPTVETCEASLVRLLATPLAGHPHPQDVPNISPTIATLTETDRETCSGSLSLSLPVVACTRADEARALAKNLTAKNALELALITVPSFSCARVLLFSRQLSISARQWTFNLNFDSAICRQAGGQAIENRS